MVSEIKARIQVHGKDNTQELIKEITDTLWSYNDVRKCVNNNYIILQSIVRNTVKSLGINADNFDIETFNDNFDVHELDTQSQDTLADSLAKVLSKFIIDKVDNNVDVQIEIAPSMIESRLKEIIDYLKSNPGDSEAVDYAKELINQLREFNRELAAKYSRELESIVNPKPAKPEPAINIEDILKPVRPKPVEPRAVVRVKPKPEQPKSVNEPKAKVIPKSQADNVARIEGLLGHYMLYVRAPMTGPYYVEKVRELIERLRKLDAEKASEYERRLNTILYEMRKYGRRVSKRRVRIHRASYRITDYFNAANETESENKEWKRYVKGILKWMAVIALI